jgi:hypothetical protein
VGEDLHLPSLGRLRMVEQNGDDTFYTRHSIVSMDSPFLAQVIRLSASSVRMSLRVSHEVMDVDFHLESTRRDVPGIYRPRPGYYLAHELRMLRDQGSKSVVFNGNNIGYWGNQFTIDGGALVYKERGGPILDDDHFSKDVSGKYTFLCYSGRFDFKDLDVAATDRQPSGTALELVASDSERPLIGLSGFPLIRSGQPVWTKYLQLAWDPRLIYPVGRLSHVDHADVLRLLTEKDPCAEKLERHGAIVVMVVEASRRSRGGSIAEIAELLTKLGVEDAIALGAAGDAQLATTVEGFLIDPLVSAHDRRVSQRVPLSARSDDLRWHRRLRARPVPSYVALELKDHGDSLTGRQPTLRSAKSQRWPSLFSSAALFRLRP